MTKFILWGLTASPYQLKMQALLDFSGHAWERWPEQGGRLSSLRMLMRLGRAKRRGTVGRYPSMSAELDEYPAVPFYTEDGRRFYYDSSSLAGYLDQHPDRRAEALQPADPQLAFICQLIDEAFDEFGLYMVHHMRWVPALAPLLAARLYRRQASRCPYLFSVAPDGYDAGVSRDRTPPSRAGFPATHELLDAAWRGYLAAMELLLAEQPYLLGERFTLADASAYGQLGMNLVDPEAIALLEKLAPKTYRWLCDIHRGRHCEQAGPLALTPALQPLLQMIGKTFIPLMVQNESAYEAARARGETLFNEAAFDCDRALYDGQLLGYPFRAVVKTFQVRVWRELKASWEALDAGARATLERDYLPGISAAFAAQGQPAA